jgi:hypothetical protein
VTQAETDRIARRRLQLWREDPIRMVREEFKAEPDAWQAEALTLFAQPATERLALKACKGPGKTTVLAWIIWNFLATRLQAKVAATSITEDNLSDNLWPELAKWQAFSPFLLAAFLWTKTRIVNRQSPETWFAAARTWPKHADAQRQAETLAGFHADHVLFVLDESGGIPQAVMTTAEAVLATGVETKVVQAGNPTHLEGPLFRACTIDAHLWKRVTVTGDPDNPHRSPRIKLEWARQQIASYGRDNPWVKVNVLGEFPDASINALLGVEDVQQAQARHLRPDVYEWSQKRLGVDVARFGDDRTVIFPRQGLASFRPVVMRNARTTDIAARVARAKATWQSEVEFVDDTGHWGHGVIDNLVTAGIPSIGVVFSDPALNPRYRNRRAEMWMEMAEWVKHGGALPKAPELLGELTVPTYSFVAGKFVLEEKDQIKARLGRSPDLADALALTFAIPDMPNEVLSRLKKAHTVAHDADPYAQDEGGQVARDFDPFDR